MRVPITLEKQGRLCDRAQIRIDQDTFEALTGIGRLLPVADVTREHSIVYTLRSHPDLRKFRVIAFPARPHLLRCWHVAFRDESSPITAFVFPTKPPTAS